MKLKLAQRIAIGYYQAKFKLLSVFSKRKAAEAVFELFCTPYSGKPKRKAPAIFEKAGKLHFDFEGLQLQGWRWKPERSNGKKILIVHGFDSCSYRFDRYITPLLQEGFEVVAFDAPGHGLSGGRTINALAYSRAILHAEKLYGSFYGIMAHSLGGLATALAFEQLPGQENRKLVLIAPTTETATAIGNFFRFIPVSRDIQAGFHKVIEEVGQKPIEYYSVKRMVQTIPAPVLWVHDEEDTICPYCDTIPVQELGLPNVEFFITKGLGHSGIYRHNEVFKKIMYFFSGHAQ
jgi:pimeloyl-ACP methyl ester carboxylesterase